MNEPTPELPRPSAAIPIPAAPPKFPGCPMPDEPVQLVRAAVHGVTHTIPELKAALDGMALDADLKAFIAKRLDAVTTNAAEFHLHDIDRPDGGFNLHIGIKHVQLGVAAKSVFIRGS